MELPAAPPERRRGGPPADAESRTVVAPLLCTQKYVVSLDNPTIGFLPLLR
jgi:hypothetical protein